MSLIIESLKKLRKPSKNKPLPPNLKPEEKSIAAKRLLIFASVIILLSGILVVIKLFENRLLLPQQNRYVQIKTEKEENIQKTAVLHSPEKVATKTLSETKSSQNKEEKIPSFAPQIEKLQSEEKNQNHSKETGDRAQKKNRYVLYLTLANKYMKKQNYHKSLEFYQKAYSIKPEEKILTNIIILKMQLGLEGAEKEIENIKNIRNLYKIAIFAVNSGKDGLIKNILQKRSSDSSGTVNYLLGVIYEKEGKLKEAEKAYEKAFKQNPSNPYISYAYGRILEINEKLFLSQKIYEHTLKIINNKNTKLRKIVIQRLEATGGSYE